MTAPRSPSVLLINPPVAKPSELPAGIARLAGALRDNGVRCEVLDLNLHCLLAQFDQEFNPADRWSRRACKDRYRNLARLRSNELYRSPDRYRRAVNDLSRVLTLAGSPAGCEISLANFTDQQKSPLASADLLASADEFQANHFYPLFSGVLREALQSYQPDYVGLSFSYLSQALTGFSVAGFIRRHFPQVSVIAGGGLISSWMSSPAWNDPFSGITDHCIEGPGEAQLLKLCGRETSTELGTFAYDGFDLDDYLAPGFVLPFAASYGCYWQKCQFCPDFAEGSCYAAKPVAETRAELEDLIHRFDPALVHLLDNAISPALLRSLASSPLSAPWYGFARFEKDLEDSTFCEALRRAGCVMLKLGLESGSQRVLDRLNKGINLDRAQRVLHNLNQVGIATYVYLLFGTPAETEVEAEKTLDFVRTHHQAINFFNLAIFNMPICSPEAAYLKDRFSDGDLSLYCDFSHPEGWGRKAVRSFLSRRFRKDELIRKIVQNQPGVFGSSHAPFLIKQKSAQVVGRFNRQHERREISRRYD